MSTNSTNPSTLFGGTWSQIQGRFFEMPSHNHSMSYANANASYGGGSYLVAGSSRISVSSLVGTPMSNSSVTAVTISSTGSGDAHNNMPPYYVVYIRRRTA